MSEYIMGAYDEALARILSDGKPKSNRRTGVKTLSITGLQTRFPLTDRFPLMSRRKVWPKAVFAELIWFLSGSTNNNDLVRLGANFWTPWVDDEFEKKHGYAPGCFGPVYGFQLRHFGGIYGNGIGGDSHTHNATGTYDRYVRLGGTSSYQEFIDRKSSLYGINGFDQLQYMCDRLKEDPTDRRIMFSLWHPPTLTAQRLPPCHYTFQVTVDDDGRMTGHLNQRSADYPVGVPANIQFYSALTMMFAQQFGFTANEFVHEAVDAHIYENQIEAVRQYLQAPERPSPRLAINKAADMFSYSTDNFVLDGYDPGPAIPLPVAV